MCIRDSTISVEGGCILETILNEVDKHDRIFPINLAAKGSCSVGGNLATNAGGKNEHKYWSTRDLVLGIEAVLPTGEIINNLIKKNFPTETRLTSIQLGKEI